MDATEVEETEVIILEEADEIIKIAYKKSVEFLRAKELLKNDVIIALHVGVKRTYLETRSPSEEEGSVSGTVVFDKESGEVQFKDPLAYILDDDYINAKKISLKDLEE